MNPANPTAIHHQLTVASHGGELSPKIPAATLFAIASQMTHCRPVSVASGIDSATCAAWVRYGVGLTCRGGAATGGDNSSRKPASEPSRGWS